MNTPTKPTNEVASSEQRVASRPKAAKPAPMTNERIEALCTRLRALDDSDERTVFWQTIGGMQYAATSTPNARVRDFFDVMERHVAEVEAKRAGVLNASQLNGTACVACGCDHRAMIPLGIETRTSSELFVCNRSECTVDPDVIRTRIPVAARVA